jgi:hypothetical protein
MDGKDESRGPRRPDRRIDADAKAAFLTALRGGATREAAAAKAGFSLTGFYGQRRRDPAFAAAWADALRQPEAARRRARAYQDRGTGGEVRIAAANRRLFQRRRRRHVRFTAERRAACLAHLVTTGDTKAAAPAAGVCEATVHNHRRGDAAFAEAYREALAASRSKLEAEAIHLALMAQARLRHALAEALDAGQYRPARCPACGHTQGEAEAFDRAMRLLARHDRQQRRAERSFKPGGRRQEWTFERSIEALETWLKGVGVEIIGEERKGEN